MGGGEAGVDVEMLTTKGDTHGFDTDNARVPIGANATVLTADSAQALGLKWAVPAAPSSEFPIVLGDTGIAASSTTATLNALTLTDAGDLTLNVASELILKAGGLANKIFTRTGAFANYVTFMAGGTTLMELNGSNNYLWLMQDTRITFGGDQGKSTECSIQYRAATDQMEFRSPNDTPRMNLTTTGADIVGKLLVDTIRQSKESKTLDSSGDFVYGYRNVLLDTFGGASSDDCNGATAAVGNCDEVIIQTEVSTRDITIKDAVAASGTNFQSAGDFTLDLDVDLWYGIANLGATSFCEISRSNNA